MKKQSRTKIKDLVDNKSQFRAIEDKEQRQLVGGFARTSAPSLSFGGVGGRLAAVSTCTACYDCDCD